uniref:HMG box domain-containing protein n=1 Tax=Odontella aurita TaxID=265563 RepID=A0A7S4HR37_9STRA
MSGATVWKHIGLHGHSVGTFTADPDGLRWKSAVMGGGDNDDISSSRVLPAKTLVAAKWTVFGRSGHVRVRSKASDPVNAELRFDGFPAADFDRLRDVLKRLFDVDLTKHAMSSAGTSFGLTDIEDGNMVFRQCILEDADEEGEEFEPRDGDEMMSANLKEISQCVLPGNNRNEIEMQFHESDAVEAGTDQLVAIRFYIPPDPDADPSELDASTPAELFQQRIMKNANIKRTTGDVIVEIPEAKGTFLTPRGRYAIELYDTFLRMRGAKYDYKIKYDDISRLFLLPKPDEVHMAFVIALDKPIRQGQQRYQNLVMQTTKDHAELTVNLDEEVLEKEYNGDLQPVMYGALSNLVAKTFKIIAKKKVFIPGKFANANQQPCVKCALRASEGHLYPLEKQFIFIHKPTVLVRFDDVESVEFQRYAGGQGSTRNFDLCVSLINSGDSSTKEYIFSGIDRSDYTGLYNFLSGKKIKIKNLQGNILDDAPSAPPVYNEDVIYGVPAGAGEMEESSEDESYGTNDEESVESESISGDDDDLGSGFDDSDLEEHRKAAKKSKPEDAKGKEKSNKKSKKRSRPEKEGSSAEVPKKSAKKSTPEDKVAPKKKKKKDPKAPKKGKSAYNYFLTAMRPKIKEQNPDATFGELSTLAGQAWKKVSNEEKEKYEKMAESDAARFKREMADYSAPSDDSEDEDEGKKKKIKKKAKSKSNKPKRGQSSYMFFAKDARAKIKEQNPDASFGEMGKMVGQAWKKLSDEEKKKYEEMAKDDGARYKREMANYSASSDDSDAGKKKVKDKNAPKKNKSSYMCFAAHIRPTVKEQNPKASFTELAKLIGEKWKNISDSEKQKYETMAKEDTVRYKREMKDYTPPPPSEPKKKPVATKKSKVIKKPESSDDDSDDDSSSDEDSSDASSDSDDSDSDSD